MKEIVDVVCDYQGVVFSGEEDECFAVSKGHGFPGWIGKCWDEVDNVRVEFGPGFRGFVWL